MINIHICTICCPNLISDVVVLMHGQFLQFSDDVIGCAVAKVPI
jgi:hypothetical protein